MAHKYTVVEGNNISLGQGGVAYLTDTNLYTPPSGAVVIAITFVEDTVFDSDTTVESTNFTSRDTPHAGGSGADSFSDDTFPAGLTIYGRFTAIDFASGAAMLYLAGI